MNEASSAEKLPCGMRFIEAFGRQRRGWIFAEMTLVVLLIGVVDYKTGYQIRLLPFYAGPVFVISWFCGVMNGVVGALIAGFVSLAADWLTQDPDLGGWTEWWEVTRHMASSIAAALVGAALRTRSDIAAARIALLERARRLEHEIVSISEAEQRRIGRDLHDGLCQYLAALSCSATSLRDDLEKSGCASEAKDADELAALLQDAVVQTRDLARALVPAHLRQVGLVVALDSLASSVTRLQGIACTFRLHGDAGDCNEETAMHLYRIAQEAINNASRHGGAKNISLSLRADVESLTLRVADDGCGFCDKKHDGIGLAMMEYRARRSGGSLSIETGSEGGAVLTCAVPRWPALSDERGKS